MKQLFDMLIARNTLHMKSSGFALIFSLLLISEATSQDLNWNIGLFTFFDNTEFSGSAFQTPQTMSGIILAPEVGMGWDTLHRFGTGLSLIHEFGSLKAIDKFYPTAYYCYNKEPWQFIMGAFPRVYALEKYPRMFFQDSISYYRPNINGIFLEVAKNHGYFNIWLDWASRQTESTREAFFLGISGRFNKGVLFAQHFGYMYHFYGVKNPVIEEALHDNILLLTSIGIDLSKKTGFTKLEADAGWVIGLERARSDQTGWIPQNGLLVETKIEFKGIGLFNSFYKGQGLFYYYKDHKNDLYWGDPIYQAKIYNRSDIYFRFFQTGKVNLDLIYSLHFAENRIYHEQALKVILDLNNIRAGSGHHR